MITTVTTTTVTTVITVAAMGLTAAVSIAAVASLIFFLTVKELASAGESGTSLRIARFFSIGILPLVMAFAVIVAVRIAEVLG
jgi:hypothetical protein